MEEQEDEKEQEEDVEEQEEGQEQEEMKEKKEEEEDGWTCSSYSFAAYAGSCLFVHAMVSQNRSMP